MVLERLLEENIMAGSSSRLSRASSHIARSVSMDSVRADSFDSPPIRTSTAMRNRF